MLKCEIVPPQKIHLTVQEKFLTNILIEIKHIFIAIARLLLGICKYSNISTVLVLQHGEK